MKTALRLLFVSVITIFSTLLILSEEGCAPLIPSEIDIKVSGSVSVAPDVSSVTGWLQLQCQNELGPTASNDQIQLCTASKVNKLLTFLESLGSSSSTTQSSGGSN